MIFVRSIPGEAAVGVGLIATPWWAQWLHVVAGVAGDLAAICGLIIGAHTIIRLIRNKRQGK